MQTLGHWKGAGTRCTLDFLVGNALPSLIHWLAAHSSYLAQSSWILCYKLTCTTYFPSVFLVQVFVQDHFIFLHAYMKSIILRCLKYVN